MREYTLTLVARDGVGHENQTTVKINVVDVNDNFPVFDRSDYTVDNVVVEEDKTISPSNKKFLVKVRFCMLVICSIVYRFSFFIIS